MAPRQEGTPEQELKAVSYYDDLGVSLVASQDEIEKAYRDLARKYHPDRNPDRKDEAAAKFKRLQEAFERLGDKDKRKLYDEYLRCNGREATET